MVAFTRCPYCGHSEVEVSASVCPICDGELAQEASSGASSVSLGSLSASTKDVAFQDLLDTPKRSQSAAEVERAIDLAGRAHTLADVRVSDVRVSDVRMSEVLDLDRSKSVEPESQKLPASETSLPSPIRIQPNKRSRTGGLAVYLYLVFFTVGVVGLHYLGGEQSLEQSEMPRKTSESERLGVRAMEQGRYAAAIKFLEQATSENKNINLLPSLALAYSQTSQIERARQVMRTYRLALQNSRTED